MTINSTIAYRISLAAALLLLAIVFYSALQPAIITCGNLNPSYQPLIAFELARSVTDLHAIFGVAPSACRTAIVTKFAFLNSGDNFLFIPLYGVFLFFFFLGARERSPTLMRACAILVVIACVADYVENACLFSIANNPDVHGTTLSLLPWATGVKWMFLAVSGAIGGLVLSGSGGLRWIVGAVCIGGAVIVCLAMIDPHSFGRFASNSVTISWIVFLVADAIFVLRRQTTAHHEPR